MRKAQGKPPIAGALRVVAEIKELASFTAAEQRYIRRSLDVAASGAEAAERWARGIAEAANIGRQARIYADLEAIRTILEAGVDPDDTRTLLPRLIAVSAFDLNNGRLSSFAAFRFLYERLLGANARPWLLSAFAAAASLPCVHPELRGELFSSVTDQDVSRYGWSNQEALFFPEWIEIVPRTLI